MDTTQTTPYISLCSGLEGIGLGLSRVVPNLRTVAYCEREGYANANLVAKVEAAFLGTAPCWTDLKTFPFAEFYTLMGGGIMSAGFPCQPFSHAGRGLSTEDPRHLYPYISDGIAAMQPGIVWLENVEGIISAKCRNQPGAEDGEPVLLYVLRDLEKRGFIATWGIFSAREVGASHQRKRVFILAVLADAQHGAGCPERGIESGQRRDTGPEYGPESGNQGATMADALGVGSGEVATGFQSAEPEPFACGEGLANSISEPRAQGQNEPENEDRRGTAAALPSDSELGNTSSDEQWRSSEREHRKGQSTGGSGCGDVANSERAKRRTEPGSRSGFEQRETAGRDEGAGRTGECGRELANASPVLRRRIIRREPLRILQAVADAYRRQQEGWAAGPGCETRIRPCSELGGPGDILADAENANGGGEQQSSAAQCGRTGPSGDCAELPGVGQADSGDQRLEERSSQSRDSGEEQSTSERGGLPMDPADGGHIEQVGEICTGRLPAFPPGPDDLEGWRKILEIDPTLEPAICELADGRPFRVDELRLAGNAVLPETAARAFCVLATQLLKEL